VDTGGANLQSIKYSLSRIGEEYKLSTQWSDFDDCEKLLLPGVGAAKNVMENLKERDLLQPLLAESTKSIIGICVGMQILFNYSEEEDTECLGLIPGEVKKFKDSSLTVPHMGWNQVSMNKEFDDYSGYYYFANSYYVESTEDITIGHSAYGNKFSAFVRYKNYYGIQFHPEKSSLLGMEFLKNLLRL
jgi:glutamine amidotransferase